MFSYNWINSFFLNCTFDLIWIIWGKKSKNIMHLATKCYWLLWSWMKIIEKSIWNWPWQWRWPPLALCMSIRNWGLCLFQDYLGPCTQPTQKWPIVFGQIIDCIKWLQFYCQYQFTLRVYLCARKIVQYIGDDSFGENCLQYENIVHSKLFLYK